jgi:hypothetical protein
VRGFALRLSRASETSFVRASPNTAADGAASKGSCPYHAVDDRFARPAWPEERPSARHISSTKSSPSSLSVIGFLTFPYRVRCLLAWSHELCLEVLRVFADTLLSFYRDQAEAKGIFGMITINARPSGFRMSETIFG